jgi:hypothetical protein
MYARPNGRKSEHEMTNILPEDETYFRSKNVKISMEELTTGQITVYADYGAKLEDGEPDEIVLVIPAGISCEEAMSRIRRKIENMTS